MLWQIRLGIALTIFASMPSGEERVVNAREEKLEAMCGPGWCDSSVSLPSLLLDEVPVPFFINSVHIGVRACNFRPSAWGNVFEVLGMCLP